MCRAVFYVFYHLRTINICTRIGFYILLSNWALVEPVHFRGRGRTIRPRRNVIRQNKYLSLTYNILDRDLLPNRPLVITSLL